MHLRPSEKRSVSVLPSILGFLSSISPLDYKVFFPQQFRHLVQACCCCLMEQRYSLIFAFGVTTKTNEREKYTQKMLQSDENKSNLIVVLHPL